MAAGEPIKFGIIGCASIAQKVSRAIKMSPLSTLYAVGSRSLEKATTFAKDNDFPETTKIYGSYEAVLDDPEVYAVYVPLPTSLHLKWAVLAAQKKKHILLEKPVALSVEDLDVILEACKSNGVQFMDATMWMHHPRTPQMKQFLDDPENFGQLKSMYSTFTFDAPPHFIENDIRVKPDLDALGALGDLGWYCIRAILWAVDYELPNTVIASRNPSINGSGVLLSCGASLYWEDGKVATFVCSFQANMTMDFTATGTNGTLRLDDFVVPVAENKASFVKAAKSWWAKRLLGWMPRTSEHDVSTDLTQEALMVEEFSRLVNSIKTEGSEPDTKWPVYSRKTQLIVDAVKASIDKGFEPIEVVS
ncbi:OLC1v1027010C1 [Oldenlandia corymbosa var. corymbosa]|uniref:OLC1v1027010C1 n=1 Tax=Oldenlandia corymbosa var. corymbosa TaxID=529605 RepID=A0AAV1CA99_OLDCO|nr:OLC1v1027010C1 [Oldenlandia corymbosa var. corymbosa]